eukprot:SAG11_NODE_1671_length_4486_cov_1.735127_5_plen_264_part_00
MEAATGSGGGGGSVGGGSGVQRGAPRVHQLRGGARCPYVPAPLPNPFLEADAARAAVLLVGEGNFSFALAKASQLPAPASQLLATSYDYGAEVLEKYPDAAENISRLGDLGVQVRHGVDATQLSLQTLAGSAVRPFDVILFNFPCTHVHYAEFPDASVASNQELLRQFFGCCAWPGDGAILAQGGEVRLTLRDCPPYTLWRVEAQAAAAGLVLHAQLPFSAAHYPGYSWVPTRQLAHILAKKRQRQAEKTTSSSTTYCFRRRE